MKEDISEQIEFDENKLFIFLKEIYLEVCENKV